MKPVRTLLNPYRVTLLMHRWLPRKSLRRLRHLFGGLCILSGGVTITALYFGTLPVMPWFGFTLITFGLWLDSFIVYAYNNSRYFRGLDSITGSSNKTTPGLQYLSATILATNPQDCVAGFFENQYGEHILSRLNLNKEQLEAYLTTSRPRLTHDSLQFNAETPITLLAVAKRLYQEDASLRAWLLTQTINQTTWEQAIALVERIHTDQMRLERWWSRDNLSRQQSLGRELSFGRHAFISSLSRPFEINSVMKESHPIYDRYVNDIGEALAKNKAGNILLLGTEGGGVIDVLTRLQHQFKSGQQLRSLHHPHLYEIDMDVFFSRFGEPEQFISNFERLLHEASEAGNIVLIFTHFSSILTRAKALGIDIVTIIDDYLISPALHIIAVDTPGAYHSHLHNQFDLTRHFTEIALDMSDLATLRTVVTDYIINQEKSYNTIMTMSGIEAIVLDAERYLTTGEMPDRAITLADSILTHAKRHHMDRVTATDVHSFVHNLINVPIGPVEDEEGELLIHLEDYLGQHVAGQPEAVRAIARTMRRARADIERHNKPIGSFLFLGPTGVGKTETAKTLARVFFQSEEAIIRFDMSEFSQSTALIDLLGTTESAGKLASALIANPYTILLLDEFEKAHRAVHDLFLQILDEGYFTTGAGEKINARTTIIIATSNAGSDIITRTVRSRQTNPHLTEEIIRSITQDRIFRPELINRFDNVIVFDPLAGEAKRQVVTKFLNQLMDRVAKQGYLVTYDESIVLLLLDQGFDPAYGARPLQRFIQNLLEDSIAKMILEKTITPGILHTLRAGQFSKQDIAQATTN